MEGGMAQRAPKGSMKQVSRPMISKQQPSTSPQKWSSFWGFASGYASGLCFGVCFGGMLRKSATFHQYISRTTEKILTHRLLSLSITIRMFIDHYSLLSVIIHYYILSFIIPLLSIIIWYYGYNDIHDIQIYSLWFSIMITGIYPEMWNNIYSDY